MSTNEENADRPAGTPRLHRNNAAEWIMTALIAPFVLAARLGRWLGMKRSGTAS
jgi:hypothetical protein